MLLLGACAPAPGPERAPDLPGATLDLSGMLRGRLDPCGCAANQKGGLAVRRTFLWQRRAVGALAIEGGGFLPEERWGEPFARTVGRIALQCLGAGEGCMDYAACGVGALDLILGAETLKELAAETQAPPLLACDLVDERGAAAFRPWIVLPFGETRVWVTALSRRPLPSRARGIGRLPWRAALGAALAAAPSDSYRVLLLDGNGAEAEAAAAAFPGRIDLILTALDEYNPTPSSMLRSARGATILDPGGGGRHVLEVNLLRKAGRTELQSYIPHPLTPLEKRYGGEPKPGAIPPDPTMAGLITAGRAALWDGEALRAAAAQGVPLSRPWGSYVGNEACFPCHEESAEAWKKSPHAHAWPTLVKDEEQRGWPITLSPDCVSCHVVGFARRTGFRSAAATPHLREVGCEECHGPGAEHVRRMQADPWQEQRAIDRAADGGLHCQRCHDTERQTQGHFIYEAKWALIRHAEPIKWASRVRRE